MSCGEEYPSCWGIDKFRRVAVPSRQQNISRPIIDRPDHMDFQASVGSSLKPGRWARSLRHALIT